MIRSIRVKLTLWYMTILAVVFAAFSVATYTLTLRVLKDETRTDLTEMAANFTTSVTQLRTEKKRHFPPNDLIKEVLQDFQFHDYGFAVFDPESRLLGKTLDADVENVNGLPGGETGFDRIDLSGETYLALERPLRLEGRNYRLVVVYSLANQIEVERRVRNIFLIIAPLLLVLAGAGGYFLARKNLRPIATMGERAKEIGAANVHERLPVANPNDEIGGLAIIFNQLLDRLDDGFEKQRRFMADASHELRTPLAIIRGESEVTLQKEDRSDEEYRESLKIVNDEGKRLSKIVDDLFTLARVDAGDLQANFREVYVDEILVACVTKIRTLAANKNIEVTTKSSETRAFGDESLLSRLFLNLLDNAVKYNHQNGKVAVSVENNVVEVRNTGEPIPPEQEGLIFERFYRIDKAHSRRADTITSGAGLGLSIAKWIAHLHHADLSLGRSETGENIFFVKFNG